MRIVNKDFKTITEDEVNLSKGTLTTTSIIREDADPIDDVTKFAWADDDYEEVLVYVPFSEPRENISTTTSSGSDDLLAVIDALLGTGGDSNE